MNTWNRTLGATAGIACWLLLASALTGCGGGGEGDPAVSSISAANVRYSRATTITISGRNLREPVDVQVEGGCEDLTLATTNDDTRQYVCDVFAVGEIRILVRTAEGRFLGRLAFQVPPPQVSITTPQGVMTVELDVAAAPAASRNFMAYVASNFYRNTLVHRAVAGRGLVAGRYTTGLNAKAPNQPAVTLDPGPGLLNLRGTLAMLPAADGTGPSAQWYINTADNPELDRPAVGEPAPVVFGRLIGGLEVADTITQVPTRVDAAKGLTDVPVTEILISATTQTR